jgi:hypothetical protein
MDALHKTVLDGIAIEVSLAKPQNDQKKKKFQMIKVNINYVISYCIIDRDITLQRGSSEFFPSPMRGGRYDYYQHVPMAPRGRGETINKTVLRLHSSTCRLFSPSNGLPTLSNARSVRSILQVAILEPSHIELLIYLYIADTDQDTSTNMVDTKTIVATHQTRHTMGHHSILLAYFQLLQYVNRSFVQYTIFSHRFHVDEECTECEELVSLEYSDIYYKLLLF